MKLLIILRNLRAISQAPQVPSQTPDTDDRPYSRNHGIPSLCLARFVCYDRHLTNNNKTATFCGSPFQHRQEESTGLSCHFSPVIESSRTPSDPPVLISQHSTHPHHDSSMQDAELHSPQRTHHRQYLLLSIGHARCAVLSRQGCYPTCLSALRRRHASRSRSTALAELRYIRHLVYSFVVSDQLFLDHR